MRTISVYYRALAFIAVLLAAYCALSASETSVAPGAPGMARGRAFAALRLVGLRKANLREDQTSAAQAGNRHAVKTMQPGRLAAAAPERRALRRSDDLALRSFAAQ